MPGESGVRILRPRPAIAVVLAMASVATAGALWWRGRPERHLARAEEAVREGEPGEALTWLDLPEGTRATRDRALLLRARVAVERGDLDGAVRALDAADPESADYPFWKGRTLYAARQPALAISWFEAARARRPDDAEACRWLATASYDLGLRPAAVAALRDATRLDPRDARLWATLGMIFEEDTEYEQARDAFENALRLDRTRSDLRIELAEMLLRSATRPAPSASWPPAGGASTRPGTPSSWRNPSRRAATSRSTAPPSTPGSPSRPTGPACSRSGPRSTYSKGGPPMPSHGSTAPSSPTRIARRRSTSAGWCGVGSGRTRSPAATSTARPR